MFSNIASCFAILMREKKGIAQVKIPHGAQLLVLVIVSA
jgi:hypothetical protein